MIDKNLINYLVVVPSHIVYNIGAQLTWGTIWLSGKKRTGLVNGMVSSWSSNALKMTNRANHNGFVSVTVVVKRWLGLLPLIIEDIQQYRAGVSPKNLPTSRVCTMAGGLFSNMTTRTNIGKIIGNANVSAVLKRFYQQVLSNRVGPLVAGVTKKLFGIVDFLLARLDLTNYLKTLIRRVPNPGVLCSIYQKNIFGNLSQVTVSTVAVLLNRYPGRQVTIPSIFTMGLTV
jgi:hypothetical protein